MKKIAQPDFLLRACGVFLSDWDKKKLTTGTKLYRSLEERGEEEVTLWEPFQNYPMEEILENIGDVADIFEEMWNIGFRAGQANPKRVKRMYNRTLQVLQPKE